LSILLGMNIMKAKGYAGFDAKSPLKYHEFNRREVGDCDVLIEIQYCGICHSDIHTVRDEWGGAHYPLTPGHEIVGVVKKVGEKVTHHHEGDIVGVGCMVNSCGDCSACNEHLEQFCQDTVFTYNSLDADGTYTMGGYSNTVVVNEQFVLKIPKNLNLAEVAPLLCAGITTYSPLKHWNIGKGHRVGIIGLGGLGHMAVKLARSFGAHVVLFTTSPNKKEDALRMGAHEVVISKNPQEMKQQVGRFDFIIDTVSAPHDVNAYLALLKNEKTLCMLGISPTPHQISSSSLVFGRKNLSGSLIGGIAETQEMLDYCGKHDITCDIELIPIQRVNEAYERVLKSDVKYRFVIDMQSLSQG
jgi:alcohol dehydrogenase (NADP+)